jgi:hypothetical protein
MAERYLAVHPEFGVYLGHCMGMGFWSKLDPVGQAYACTFKDEAQMREFIQMWETPIPDIKAVRVLTQEKVGTDGSCYATIPEVIEAGLEGWDPNGDGAE